MIIGINATYLASKKKTGVENYATSLVYSLLNNDKENSYRLFSPKFIDRKSLPNTTNYKLHFSPFPRGWHRFRLPLSLLRHKVDIFFDPGYTVPPFISIPTVVSIHDLAHKYFPEAYTNDQIRSLERSFKLAHHKAAGLVFSSQSTKNDFNKFYPGYNGQSSVIYMGYSENFQTDRPKDILHLAEPYILYVGRLEKKKNIVNLIRAYVAMRHKNPEIKHHLVLCGMPGHGFDKIEEEIKRNAKFGKDIIITGYVSGKDLPHYYHNADLFAYPSLYEGFGIPLLEAFSCQVPIAAANSSSIPEVAGDAAFYFEPDSVDHMAEILKQAITDKDMRTKHIKSGLLRLNNFTWSHYTSEFLKFLTKVYDESRHSS